ncbi:MAG: glycoside hydrolase family 25 protein [Lachnospiraceae bacterium]|nr:glycoside hydrolase family 25 protein [Candidatus Merdinaster equi]
MGSKLVARTIIICSLCILLILGVIFIANKTGILGGEGGGTSPNNEELLSMSSDQYVLNSGNNIALNGDVRAFMSDESFWDTEEIGEGLSDIIDTDAVNNELVRVKLSAISVDHDLRVQILDNQGKRVTGVSFYITIEDVGQFKDLDKDGVIYVGDMEPGDYAVSVDPLEGFLVASSRLNVHVKDALEYRTINDIALLMHMESEVDAENDIYNEPCGKSDTDSTEKITRFQNLVNTKTGIDVSSNNGEIEWKKVANDGIDFAMLRVGMRGYTSGNLIADQRFTDNIVKAQAAGIKVGIFFFSQAINEKEAVEEASLAINLSRSYDLDLPIYVQMQNIGGKGRADNLSVEERTRIATAFCRTVSNAGYRTGVSASASYIQNELDRNETGKYLTWLAEYRGETTYPGIYQMWQYTGNGVVDGITGAVHLNIGNLDNTYIDEYRSVKASESDIDRVKDPLDSDDEDDLQSEQNNEETISRYDEPEENEQNSNSNNETEDRIGWG